MGSRGREVAAIRRRPVLSTVIWTSLNFWVPQVSQKAENRSAESHRTEIDEAVIDGIVRDFVQPELPGIVVGISRAGRPVYRKGFGLASIELPYALTPGIRMRVGSISKQLTALGFMLLCEAGKARIDDSLGTYFPEFHPITHRVTMRQVLGHTSGLPDACDIRFRLAGFEGRPIWSRDILALYRGLSQLQYEPGTKWRYNNAGYMIISEVIERITDTGFGEYLRDKVFSRIGMWDTLVKPWDTDFIPNCATPHTMVGGGRFEKRYLGVDGAGAGSILSTVDDMLRWLGHMDNPIVGSRETWNLMKTPQVLANGSSTGYGFGLSHGTYRGIETLGHQGGWIGGNSQALKIPLAKLDIVVISNRSDVFSPVVVNRIMDSCIPALAPVSELVRGGEGFSMYRVQASGELQSGTKGAAHQIYRSFYSQKTRRVVQIFGRDGHTIVSVNGNDVPNRNAREREFVPIAIWSHLRQSVALVGDRNEQEQLVLIDFGEVDEFDAIQEDGSHSPERVVGRYLLSLIGAVAEITVCDGTYHLHTESRLGSMDYTLEHIGRRIWRLNSSVSTLLNAILHFDDRYNSFEINTDTGSTLTFSRDL